MNPWSFFFIGYVFSQPLMFYTLYPKFRKNPFSPVVRRPFLYLLFLTLVIAFT